jgi:hypothetical protein
MRQLLYFSSPLQVPGYSPCLHVCCCCARALQVLVELPYVILQSLLYGTITYLLVHFELYAAKFWWYILFTFLTLLFFTYYGEGAGSGLICMWLRSY